MKEAAASYNDRLQDFLATQIMTRSTASAGSNPHWKILETQESDLSYVGHKVNSQLMQVNGKITNLDKAVKGGYFTFASAFGALQPPGITAWFTPIATPGWSCGSIWKPIRPR